MKKTIFINMLLLMMLLILLPVLSFSESEESLSIKASDPEIVCNRDGEAEFTLSLSNTGDSAMCDVSLILESLMDVSDPESIVGEIAVLSVNEVPEDEPSDYIWIDEIQAGCQMTFQVKFNSAGNENDPIWIRASVCDEEYNEMAVSEIRCTRPGNGTQNNGLCVAGIPVVRILLILIALNAILWTGVILTDKAKKKKNVA